MTCATISDLIFDANPQNEKKVRSRLAGMFSETNIPGFNVQSDMLVFATSCKRCRSSSTPVSRVFTECIFTPRSPTSQVNPAERCWLNCYLATLTLVPRSDRSVTEGLPFWCALKDSLKHVGAILGGAKGQPTNFLSSMLVMTVFSAPIIPRLTRQPCQHSGATFPLSLV